MIRHFTSSSGTKISIGRNAKGNDYLCKHSEKDEYWLHLQDDPSPHAIVHNHIEDENSLTEAAILVKYYSKLKNAKYANIIYCQIEDIKPTKTLGMVTLLKQPKIITI